MIALFFKTHFICFKKMKELAQNLKFHNLVDQYNWEPKMQFVSKLFFKNSLLVEFGIACNKQAIPPAESGVA